MREGYHHIVYSGAADGRVVCTVKEQRWTLAWELVCPGACVNLPYGQSRAKFLRVSHLCFSRPSWIVEIASMYGYREQLSRGVVGPPVQAVPDPALEIVFVRFVRWLTTSLVFLA